ncbi:MFS transporter [Alteromonas ponticola]|uniref:MFS transporter n=1 Tax=Alteromonas aquimaris TaxID=2998417 RepID=A0ABT3P4L2_9ALTE|nr:MFS transporter [Alteromonas aquimaris]MCW8107721.1 MFS transporter [Alteromonas aquimaris]
MNLPSTGETRISPLNLVLLCVTYLLYFGQLGVLVPYLGIFLDGRGYSSEQIGELFAIITLARILGPSLWASIADKSGKTLRVLQLGCVLTVCSFATIFWQDTFWGLAFSFGMMMMFWTAVLPQLEVITMQSVKLAGSNYGTIRLWGSIGFIILTIAVGKALDYFTTEVPIYASMFTLTALMVSTFFLTQPATSKRTNEQSGDFWKVIKHPAFIVFILSATLLQVSFGTYYGFFTLYLRDLGYSGQQTGLLIALGVVAEVVIFMYAQKLLNRYSVSSLLVLSGVLTALRWYALGAWGSHATVVIVSQLLHAFSFGLTHAASVHFIHHRLPAHFHSRGQAIYISVAFGLGGASGNYIAGQIWQQGTNAYLSFSFSATLALLSAFVFGIFSFKKWQSA